MRRAWLPLHPDEHYYRDAALTFAERGTLEPRMYVYGGLAFTPVYAVLRIGHGLERAFTGEERSFVEWLREDPRAVTLWQRRWSALLGTLTLLVAFALGRALYSDLAGLGAAFLLAVAPLHVRDCHFGVLDAPLTLLVAWSMLWIARAARSGRLGHFAAAGALAGLAAAVKYVPAVLAVPIVFAAFASGRGRTGGTTRLAWRATAVAGACMIGAFLLGAPYTLLDFPAFAADLARQRLVSTWDEYRFPEWRSSPEYHLRYSLGLGLGPWLAWFSGAAVLAALVRGTAALRSVVIALVVLFAGIGLGTSAYPRYALPLFPGLAALAAWAACAALSARRSGRRALAASAALLVVAAPSLLASLREARLFARETTLEELQRFADERIPDGATVAVTHPDYALPLRSRLDFAPWDPEALAAGAASWLIVFDHPSPYVPAPRGAERVVAAGFEREPAARIAGRVAGTGALPVTYNDYVYVPLAGLAALERIGPNVTVFEALPPGVPRGPRGRPTLPVENLRRRVPIGGGVPVLEWDLPDDPELAGLRLRVEPAAGEGPSAAWGPPITSLQPASADHLDVHLMPPGRYRLFVTVVGTGGPGPRAGPLEFEVQGP